MITLYNVKMSVKDILLSLSIYIYSCMSNLNRSELNKIVREMQNASLEQHKAANNYNALGAAIVKHGAEDKMRARGWPVSNTPNVVSDKRLI